MKRPIDRLRDSALSMEVGSTTSPITGMVKIGDRLHIVKADSIYRVTFADEVDPDRTNIDIPNSQQKVLEYGSDSSLVGKTLLTAKQLFDGGFLGRHFDSETAIGLSFECLKNLAAMSDLALAFKKQDEHEEEFLSQQTIKNRSLMLPSAPNLEPRCKEFVQRADHALQALFGISSLFYGGKIKGWFEGLADEVSRRHQGDTTYLEFMADAAKFCKSMRSTRNCIEHKKANEWVEVLNYTLTHKNEVSPPTITVHHPKHPQLKTPVAAYTTQVTDHIANIFELMIAFMCSRHIDRSVKLPIEVRELPPDQRPNRFVKYSYGLAANDQSMSDTR